jgi:hypothetical protein
MSTLVPVWILGAPFVGLLVLAFSFKGPSAMGGGLPRPLPRHGSAPDTAAPAVQPLYPQARRNS